MSNPLLTTPLNTKQVYVMGVTNTGCEVYMPVDSFEQTEQLDKRDELQAYLDNQKQLPQTLV